MVELNPAFAEDGEAPKPRPESDVQVGEADNVVAFRPASEQPQADAQAAATSSPAAAEPVVRIGENAEGVRAAAQLLAGAVNARWPMYLRNVKQILRTGNLDERKYGFGGLMDLLKACQRDGLVRIKRDRRGGLRVFQGPNMARPAGQPQGQYAEPTQGEDGQPISPDSELADDVQPMMVEVTDQSEPDIIEIEPVSVVDTTAELLGRAKPRAPRARAGRSGVAAAPSSPSTRSRAGGSSGGATSRKPAAKKTAAKRPAARSRKPVNKNDDDFGNR